MHTLTFEVHKKRDGFSVIRRADGRSDFLGMFEGLAWRLFGRLPKRILNWSAADAAVSMRTVL